MGALRYKNFDKRCTIPFSTDLSSYCYSYASHVDGYLSKKEMERACEICKYWTVPEQKPEIDIDKSQ